MAIVFEPDMDGAFNKQLVWPMQEILEIGEEVTPYIEKVRYQVQGQYINKYNGGVTKTIKRREFDTSIIIKITFSGDTSSAILDRLRKMVLGINGAGASIRFYDREGYTCKTTETILYTCKLMNGPDFVQNSVKRNGGFFNLRCISRTAL